jgi:hypothetical protein
LHRLRWRKTPSALFCKRAIDAEQQKIPRRIGGMTAAFHTLWSRSRFVILDRMSDSMVLNLKIILADCLDLNVCEVGRET